jgi:hypothetical protein
VILDALIGASQRLTRAAWGAANSSPLPYTGLLTQDKNGIAALELMRQSAGSSLQRRQRAERLLRQVVTGASR